MMKHGVDLLILDKKFLFQCQQKQHLWVYCGTSSLIWDYNIFQMVFVGLLITYIRNKS